MATLTAAATGVVLSGTLTGLLGTLGPQEHLPRLSVHHPWAAYRALGAAAGPSALTVFALTVFVCTACLFLTWRSR